MTTECQECLEKERYIERLQEAIRKWDEAIDALHSASFDEHNDACDVLSAARAEAKRLAGGKHE